MTNGISRRRFLQHSLTAAAIPALIPSKVWAAQGNTAPNNRICLGIIGTGKLGRESHLEALLYRDDIQIQAVCDVEEGRLQKSKARTEEMYAQKSNLASWKGCTTYHNFEDLLARDDIDAVLIATPDHWHAFVAIAAAKAGKDIYCEKPMTRYIKDGRAVVNAVRRYGRVFQTGSQQRSEFEANFIRAAELVRNGVIGEIKSVNIGIGGFPISSDYLPAEPTPPSLDWDRWLGPAPYRPYSSELCPMNSPNWPNWRGHSEYAGGGFSDFGAHHLDIAQWALGMDDSGPVDIIPPDGKDVKRMTFIYANGIPLYHGGEVDCEFHGTKGTIYAARSYLRADPPSILDTKLDVNAVHLNRHKGHHQDWLDCIRTREKPVADVEIGHRSSTFCQLGNICNVVNRRLKWDPVKEEFVGDDEANKLLDRVNRSPWEIS